MAIARHRHGLRGAAAALQSQIHPVFMLPPIAAAGFGAILAGSFSIRLGAIHTIAIFMAVYTAHVKDGYVDFYIRGEDDDHPLTPFGCRVALTIAFIGFWVATIMLWWFVDLWAALLTIPGWLIGIAHAPHLDMTTLGETFGYPAGIALAVLGGYYVQVQAIGLDALALAAILFILLGGVKIIDDEQDHATDLAFEKPSMAVVLGPGRARGLAGGLLVLALAGTILVSASGIFPLAAMIAPLAFVPVAAIAVRKDATIATAMLIRGCYVFLAVLIAAVWFRPF